MPPADQAWGWWVSHQAGGDGATVGLALVVLEPDGFALGCGVQPAGAAEVEDLGLPAEDGGQDLGLAGEAAGLGGGDGVAGLEGRDAGLLQVWR